ncbi:hypothetical protein MG293_005778 [Ovis ammon polii]|uniref:Uncharacterized protein n=1 Tax=Ovis ammon polii TaxID=230172 RepID=A0AAD4UIY8_OVIAM|nr:hypothetical protein MG293_005778 [Ovis ammon polii]
MQYLPNDIDLEESGGKQELIYQVLAVGKARCWAYEATVLGALKGPSSLASCCPADRTIFKERTSVYFPDKARKNTSFALREFQVHKGLFWPQFEGQMEQVGVIAGIPPPRSPPPPPSCLTSQRKSGPSDKVVRDAVLNGRCLTSWTLESTRAR